MPRNDWVCAAVVLLRLIRSSHSELSWALGRSAGLTGQAKYELFIQLKLTFVPNVEKFETKTEVPSRVFELQMYKWFMFVPNLVRSKYPGRCEWQSPPGWASGPRSPPQSRESASIKLYSGRRLSLRQTGGQFHYLRNLQTAGRESKVGIYLLGPQQVFRDEKRVGGW